MLWRKFVFRRVLLGIWAMSVEESRRPGPDTGLRFEVWGPDRYDSVRSSNPHLTDEDIDNFRRQKSVCVVALDGNRIAGSVWATQGRVWVSELHRFVDVGSHEHFMRRGYSDPDYRGKALLAWMQYHYCRDLPPHDRLWSATFPTNEAAVKTHEKVGRRREGDIWSTYVFGRQFSGQRSYPPRRLHSNGPSSAGSTGRSG